MTSVAERMISAWAPGTTDSSYGGNGDAFVAAFSMDAAPIVTLSSGILGYSENTGPLALDGTPLPPSRWWPRR